MYKKLGLDVEVCLQHAVQRGLRGGRVAAAAGAAAGPGRARGGELQPGPGLAHADQDLPERSENRRGKI